jgi:hypothetical protein
VTSAPAGIDCPAGSGGTCVVSDSQTITCVDGECGEPDDAAWQTYALSASGGPAGFAASWSGSCSGSACSVKLTLANRTVALGWQDVTNPAVSLTAPGAKVGKVMAATASAGDNDGVARVEFYVDGVLKATDTLAPYAASIAMDGYAQGSAHTLLARAFDLGGRAADASKSVTVDKQVNLALGTVPAFTNAATVPLAIGTDADATIRCRLDGALAPCAGTFSPVTGASADGSYTYEVTATDDVANTTSGTRSFVLDRTAPAIGAFDGPVEGGQVTTDAVTIAYGVVDADPDTVSCSLDGAPLACGATSAALTGLADGGHTFTVTARDKAGNEGSKTRVFSVKKAAPGAGETAPGGGTATPGQLPPAGGGTLLPTAHGGPLANPATFRYGFDRRGALTTFTGLTITNIAAGSTVKATCRGGGCPRKAIVATKKSTVSLTAFLKRKLRPGAVLTIDVTKPGMTTKHVKLTVRKGQNPKLG